MNTTGPFCLFCGGGYGLPLLIVKLKKVFKKYKSGKTVTNFGDDVRLVSGGGWGLAVRQDPADQQICQRGF